MPVEVISGKECIVRNSSIFSRFGTKAMIVTGRSSAKINGSLKDVIEALDKEGIDHCLFDKVMSNPTIECAYEGAVMAKAEVVEFIIAIGGGSPIDGAKAMALLARQAIAEEDLFGGKYDEDALPLIAVPTTAGTGSEVTQYAILTNDRAETKSGLATPLIFPKVAFLDGRYMAGLSAEITVNTGIDALSHAVEGMLSVRKSFMSDVLATHSIEMIMSTVDTMKAALEQNSAAVFSENDRDTLLKASMLAGMVIAHTGTTAVHAMGYSLTYYRHIDHGRANGLLLGHYMQLIEKEEPQVIEVILDAMGLQTSQQFVELMDDLFGNKEVMAQEELNRYAGKAIVTGNINNCIVKPTEQELKAVFETAFC